MTLVAIACKGHTADLVTDSLAPSAYARHLKAYSKVRLLHHLDTAMVLQGHTQFARQVDLLAPFLAEDHAQLDTYLQRLAAGLHVAWEPHRDEPDAHSYAYLVGHSAAEGRFVAWQLRSCDDFEPRRLPAVFVSPSPFEYRLSAHEWQIAREDLSATEWTTWERFYREWDARPELTAPRSPDEWLAVVQAARRRAISGNPFRWIFGGPIYLTTLERDASRTTVLHRFDDSPAELAGLVRNSLHPLAHAAPCHCGSRRPFRDCCLPGRDQPCWCGSGMVMDECCLITDEEAAERATVLAQTDS